MLRNTMEVGGIRIDTEGYRPTCLVLLADAFTR